MRVIPVDEHTNAIPKCPDDVRFFVNSFFVGGIAHPALQRKSDVEFDASAASKLRHTVTSIDNGEYALDIIPRVQGCV